MVFQTRVAVSNPIILSSTHFYALYFLFFRFEFVQIPLFHPLFKRDHPSVVPRTGPPTRSDTVLTGNDWATLVVAKLSPWLQLESRDPDIRRLSEDVSWEEDNGCIFVLNLHFIHTTQHWIRVWIVGKPGLHRGFFLGGGGGGGTVKGVRHSIQFTASTAH